MSGQSFAHGRPSPFDSIETWMAQRNADVQRLAAGAHAIGRRVWDDGNKLGQYVTAAKPSDVAALVGAPMALVLPLFNGEARDWD